MSEYSAHFLIRGKDVSQHAADYLSGLLGTYRRKNLECIHGDIPESNYQAMQQFVSDSPWSQDNLMTQVAGEVNGLLGGIRRTSQGELRAKVWVGEVWVWEDRSAPPLARRIVAREMEGGEIKVSWTNAPKEMSDEELAYMQGQRHWIERGFEDAKSQLGMADYEVRKWRGWHHHMAMVALAMLFLLKERAEHEQSAPLLSARDIVELLAFYLPRRRRKEQEVISDLVRRHRQRQAATNGHARRQQKKRLES
jgi:SRSO17 transposase